MSFSFLRTLPCPDTFQIHFMTTKHPNHLAAETSPYLLQHAHNPVDWYPWGEEALNRAVQENKPILVSIGYAACHWCHVMERESFEDEATASIMNEHFVNIKIDREERPDLDHIYMDAVQAMTGSGGWPLNVFLTPERKPFYGGTYFPPKRAFNRPSWQETLYGVIQAFRERRHEIDAQAENLTEHLLKSNTFGLQINPAEDLFTAAQADLVFENLMKSADRRWGGFGRAPKFPQTGPIQYLLHYHYLTGNEEALSHALLSLDKMIAGGLYDQLGGGFARYSTDTEWLAPHFEKMLYDNALLVSVLCDAYQLTRNSRYRQVIEQTLAFVQRELMHPGKGFYAALDADSEGVEGKYYVWQKAEAEALLGEEADLFCRFYDISEEGNWEHTNILWVKRPLEEWAQANGLDQADTEKRLATARQRLLVEREKRIRPLLDDKVLLGWNALMNMAFSKAFAATGQEEYRQLAIDNMSFLLKAFAAGEKGRYYHTWKNGQARYPAFLDDGACLVQALLHLQEITADRNWLQLAREVTEGLLADFSEDETGFFYYTPAWQPDVIVRKKEVYDGATPSGNAVMATNLWRLAILLDRADWRERSVGMVKGLGQAIGRYPTSFGQWACLLQEMVAGTNEIAITGPGYQAEMTAVLAEFIPHKVMMASSEAEPAYPVLMDKNPGRKTAIYLCRNNTCLNPVFSTSELMLLINKAKNR